jgi:hypothetical protein
MYFYRRIGSMLTDERSWMEPPGTMALLLQTSSVWWSSGRQSSIGRDRFYDTRG